MRQNSYLMSTISSMVDTEDVLQSGSSLDVIAHSKKEDSDLKISMESCVKLSPYPDQDF